MSNGSSPITAFKKKLHGLNLQNPPPPLSIQGAGKRPRLQPADPASLERQVRQLLADKVSGNLLGLWLLVPEHLRLGTWDLRRAWSGELADDALAPRLADVPPWTAPCCRSSQRTGERPQDYHFKGFCSTGLRPEVPTLTADFPQRWHIEEFFRFDQHLGWKRAGTMNLHLRLGLSTGLAEDALDWLPPLETAGQKRARTPALLWLRPCRAASSVVEPEMRGIHILRGSSSVFEPPGASEASSPDRRPGLGAVAEDWAKSARPRAPLSCKES